MKNPIKAETLDRGAIECYKSSIKNTLAQKTFPQDV